MNVLVDTSVWIRFLSNRNPYASALYDLLERDEVLGHDLVYGELLIGDSGNRSELLAFYGAMYRVQTVRHSEVVTFVRTRNLHAIGIGWIDAHLLASALVADVPLWTADQRVADIASDLGTGYEPKIT